MASITAAKFSSEICATGVIAGIESKSESIPRDFNLTRAESADELSTAPCQA